MIVFKWSIIRLSLLLLGCGILTSGCYIASLQPIVQPDQRVFDSRLMGVWTNGSDTLKIQGTSVEDLTFEVIEGPGPMTDSVRRSDMEIALAHIEGQNYIDVRPGEILDSPLPVFEQMLLFPMHAVVRYQVKGDSLVLQHLEYRKFDQKNSRGRAFGLELERMTSDGPILITSATHKIRRFLAKYGQDDSMFEQPTVYIRQG